MWLLIIIAVNINNPQDVPATITLDMPSLHMCEEVLDSLKYKMKYTSYKVEGKCQKQS